MATTYIYAIGGTGSRVLRSLSMFLAAGCGGTAVNSEIVPIILDYDTTNGDLKKTIEVLERYNKIHSAIYQPTDSDKTTFFGTPVIKIKDKAAQAQNPDGIVFQQQSGYNACLNGAPGQGNANGTLTFDKFLGLQTMTPQNGSYETHQLLTSLYNNNPQDDALTELYMDFVQGFLGCPNIGCLVSKNFTETAEYQSACSNFNPNSDKILIIGSVFGGTGASGIPMLLDALRDDQRTNNAKIAVLAMLPYYKIDQDPHSPVSSETFMAKTKAAMTAYELPNNVNAKADRLYYVGDPDMFMAFPNNPGKDRQINKALFAEFVAAMCVVDFMQLPINSIPNGAYECGLTDNAPISSPGNPIAGTEHTIKWEHFFDKETITPFIEPLMRFTIFEKFFAEYKPVANDTWFGNNGLDDSNDLVIALRDYSEDLFTWLAELAGPYRPLLLFHPKKDGYDDLLEHKPLARPGFMGIGRQHAFKERDIADEFGRAFRNYQTLTGRTPEYRFIKTVDEAMRVISSKIKNF